MKKVSMKGKLKVDLDKLLKENQKKLENIVFASTGARAKNVHEQSEIRKTIARIKTELSAIQMQK